MYKTLIILSCFTVLSLQAGPTVVSHDEPYYTANVRNTQLIYSEENLPVAKDAARVEMLLQPEYERAFGYVMDERLYVGLLSQNNQIANGFSTQYPNNRQMNFIGGALMPDYFSAASWLDTLLYHETCHNYQFNAKDNVISSSLHTVFGNGLFLYFPWFTVPNTAESSFMSEGNAVLNESWHGNGGRLFSGRFKIATLMQAKAGYLTPERVYNDNYYFLYGSHFYTLGGYYNYYLAEHYGLEKTNSYWKNHSHYWYWPFFTNNAMQDSIGVDFETSFNDWRKAMEAEAEHVVRTHGRRLAGTQFISPLNGDGDEIYTIVNETGRDMPELVVYDKQSGKTKKIPQPWLQDKVIRLPDGRYTTQSSRNTNPWRVKAGLFDDSAFIIGGTEGKAVQGFLSDGRMVYFDIPSSFEYPQLYVGGTFYGTANSSVLVEGDDLYYCKQKGKTRTYFKNKTPLFSVQGYYGWPVGTDRDGSVYFIGNTAYGSGLFRYHNGTFERMSPADTIVDARIIDKDHALILAMGSDEATLEKITLDANPESPTEVKLFVENEPYYNAVDPKSNPPKNTPAVDLNDSYHSVLDMHYSATNLMAGYDQDAGAVFNIDINFADPLTQNSFSLFAMRNLDEYTLAGAGYTNTQYFIHYSVQGYGVIDRPEDNASDPSDDSRDYGLIAYASIPFVQTGYYHADLSASYFQDYNASSREPIGVQLSVYNAKRYGASMFTNFLLRATGYGASDRGTLAYGGSADWKQGLPYEFFIGLGGQYSASEADSPLNDHGIKVTNYQPIDADPTAIIMPSLKNSGYAKSVTKGSAELKKVLNGAAYFFTFPVSLRREALYAKYNYYHIDNFGASTDEVNEAIAGFQFDTLILNVAPIGFALEYLYNDNQNYADENTFRFRLTLGL